MFNDTGAEVVVN